MNSKQAEAPHFLRTGVRILIGFAIAITSTVAITAASPAGVATALDAFAISSVKGVWDEDGVQAAETTDEPDCLTFGKDESSTDGSFDSGQNTNASQPTVRNQVRFGHPSNVGNDQCGNVNDRSGFGFAGVANPTFSDLFEIGRVTHFNRPIQSDNDNAGTAILDTTFNFADETTSPATQTSLGVEYEVELDETPNGANPCKYVTGGGNVPPGVTVDNGAGCADRIQISVANQNVTRTIGQTDITFEIGGFGQVSNNTCGTPQANGNIVFTREGGERQACVFAQPARGTLIINKAVEGGGSGSYPFTYREISQKFETKGQAIGSAVNTNVSVTNGTGSSGAISLAPGLYNLSEVTASLAANVDFKSVSCTSNGQTATLASYEGNTTAGANVVVDLDSNETVTCTYTNRKAAKITIVKDAQPNDARDFTFDTTSLPATPNSPKFGDLPTTFDLDDDGNATLSNTFTQFVDAGTYTVTEQVAAAWRLNSQPTCTFTTSQPGSSASGNLQSRTVSLTLTPGAEVTCTFVNAPIPPPDVSVTKTRNPGEFAETDGTVAYDIAIKNDGAERIRVTALRDLIILNGAAPGTATDANLADADPASPANVGGDFTLNSCDELVAASAWIAPGATINCSFTISYTGRDAPQQIDDTVTVTVVDDFARNDTAQSSANVKVTPRNPVIVVDKVAVVETVAVAPGGPLTYDVVVSNGKKDAQGVITTEAFEAITITTVTDQMSVDRAGAPETFDPFGPALDITTVATPIDSTNCNLLIGLTLAPYESITCRFVVDTTDFVPAATLFDGDEVRNTVTVTAQDDDGTSVSGTGAADRDVVASPPKFEVFKTDGGREIVEPGTGPEGLVTYHFLIDNTGDVGINEPLTITGFRDVIAYEGVEIGTVEFVAPGPLSSNFTKPGVSLVSETCSALYGTTLYPKTGTTQQDGYLGDSDYTRSTPIAGQPNAAGAECTITLQLPGLAGDEYTDDVFFSAVEGVGTGGTKLPDATDDAETPIVERPPSITITKTPSKTSIPETGESVTFTFVVTNTSGTTDPVTITGFGDVPFGNLLTEDRADTTCDTALVVTHDPFVGITIPPGGTASCELTVFLAGDAPDVHTDTVTVNAVDDEGTTVSANDSADVTFTDVLPLIDVTKTAIAVNNEELDPPGNASVSEFGGSVTFEVVVTNTRNEALTLTSLVDEIGLDTTNLNGVGTCSLTGPVVLAPAGSPGDSYTCTFPLDIEQIAGEDIHVNTVTAKAEDDEGHEASDFDPETVTFITEPPVVSIDKDDKFASVDEPGGTVTYYLTITNGPADPQAPAAKEAITSIESLTDTITYEKPAVTLPTIDLLLAADTDLDDAMTRNTCPDAITAALPLSPGASFTCEFDIVLTGTAQLVSDTVRVIASDDDEEESPPATDDELTPIEDVAIDFSITKTADTGNSDQLLVTASNPSPVEYTFEVVNLSTIEPLYLVGLDDNQFGDLSEACGWTIESPVILQPNGSTDGADQPTDRTTCTLDRSPTFPADGIHTNVATAIGGDDEIYDALTDDDDSTTATWIPRSDDATVYEEATITVVKQATPPTTAFTFRLDGAADRTTTPSAGVYPSVGWDQLRAGSYDVTELVPANWTLKTVSCTVDGQPTVFDSITDGVEVDVTAGQDVVCTFSNVQQGEVSIDKSLTSGPTQRPGTNEYDLEYTVTITNDSYDTEEFQVFDELSFPVGTVEIGEITSSGPTFDADWDGTGELTDGVQTIAGRTQAEPTTETIVVPVVLTLPGSAVLGAECPRTGDPTREAVNSVSLTVDAEQPDDEVCTPLDDPVIDDAKQVDPDLTKFENGVWTIVYDITVENTGDGPGQYSIDDTLEFGEGVVVTSAAVTEVTVTGQTSPAGPTPGSVEPTFNPDPDHVEYDKTLVEDIDIVAKATHVYQVTVTATIADPATGAGACDPDGAEAGGFLNTATITLNGTPLPPVDDCEPFSTITLTKVLVNDDGGNATIDQFELTATPAGDDSPTVSGKAPSPVGSTYSITGAVPSGSYVLDETDVDGYTASGWDCVQLVADGDPVELDLTGTDTVSVSEGSDVSCEIENDDDVVDLELTKDDGGITATAGGAPFTYTITVENIGDRDMDDEVVTIVDVLPAEFTWVSFPNIAPTLPLCAQSGQTLTCNVAPALLKAGGTATIIATVQAKADTPAGTYTNKAFVTTEDDPVCPEGQQCDPDCDVTPGECTPPTCPVIDEQSPEPVNNNVGCDDTPVDTSSTITVSKTDDVADGESVQNGDTFSYDITVKNNGPAVVSDVAFFDDLPSGLTLVSVVPAVGADWTCNAIDPVECDYAFDLASGATTSKITITVLVENVFFPGNEIVNGVEAAAIVETLEGDDYIGDTDVETTPLEPRIELTGWTADCIGDAPWVYYEIDTFGLDSPTSATITLYLKGTNTQVDQFVVTDFTGTFLYPGAEVDGLGNGVDWPGWILVDDAWELDSTDAELRDGLDIHVSVNPEADTSVDYPAADPACANPPVELMFDKTDGGAEPRVGEEFDYVLTVTNIGGSTPVGDEAGKVQVTDVLPAEFEWVSFPSDPLGDVVCSVSGQLLTCDVDAALLTAPLGDVSFGARAKVRVGTEPSDVGYTNIGWVDTPEDPVCPEPDQGEQSEQTALLVFPEGCDPSCEDVENNNVDCEDTPVKSYDVVIVKSASGVPGGTLSNGEQFTYTLTVTNDGTGTATDVVVTDQVHARLRIDAISAPGWTNQTVGNAVKLSRASMAPKQSVQVVLTVTLLPANNPAPIEILDGEPAPPLPAIEVASLLNEACVAAAIDQNTGNNCDTATVPVDDIVAVVYVRCVNDAPLMGYSVRTTPSLANQPITLTWTPNQATAQTEPQQIVIGMKSGDSDEVPWPGALFDINRVSIDYPGWRLIEESDYVNGVLPASAEVFNGLIRDTAEPDEAWRYDTTLTFSVNPDITFQAPYPDITAECAAVRSADLEIVKTASVTEALAGTTFSYSIDVTNTSTSGAAEPVVLTDPIPAQLKVESIVTSTTAFPRWTNCDVVGEDAQGYGGQLRCDLFGPLMMGDSAPRVTLGVRANPAASGQVTNTAVVNWQLANDPDSEPRFADDSATVTITAIEVQPPTPTVPVLPPTGSNSTQPILWAALMTLLAGGIIVLITRRRRGDSL